jgi:hypothetical protein
MSLLLNVIAALLLTANVAIAQEETTLKDTTPKKRLRSQSMVKGFIGGESHDSYVIRGRKGETLSVQISWRLVGENRCEFTVSESPNAFSGEPVAFGSRSVDDKHWNGKIPKTRDYYIYVVAHPSAHYILWVALKK